MKTLLLLAGLLAFSVTVRAQAVQPLPPIPTDSATGKVTYQGVVQVPGVSADELYSRAREWAATYFVSGKAVLDMDDRAAGKLIGNSYSTFNYTMILTPFEYHLWRTTKIYVRDGRYRFEVTDFSVALNQTSTSTPASMIGNKTPIETYVGPAALKNTFLWDRKGNPKGLNKALIPSLDKSANEEVAALERAMKAAAGAKKDW